MSDKDENNNLNEPGKTPFSLPEGYFDSFAQKMIRKIELTEEIKEFKTLSSIEKKLPFVTPENYFIRGFASVEAKEELSAFEKLSALRNANIFSVPEFYFESNEARIRNRIELAEELQQYPLLAATEKQNVFVVSQGYFDDLSYKVRERLSERTPKGQSVTSVLRIVFSKKTVYAMAAVLVVTLGIYYYSNQTTEVGPCEGIACLDRAEVLKETQLINMDDESLIQIVDPESLSKNLDKSLSGEEKKSDEKEKEDFVIENTDVNDIVDEI